MFSRVIDLHEENNSSSNLRLESVRGYNSLSLFKPTTLWKVIFENQYTLYVKFAEHKQNGGTSPVNAPEGGSPQTAAHVQKHHSTWWICSCSRGRRRLQDEWINHSPQSALHATAVNLTQSWSATLPGLDLHKCPQDNSYFFMITDVQDSDLYFVFCACK